MQSGGWNGYREWLDVGIIEKNKHNRKINKTTDTENGSQPGTTKTGTDCENSFAHLLYLEIHA